jgi:hypothetical protein
VLSLSTQASAHRTACHPGVRTVKGVKTRTFCGPAKAQVTIHTVDYRFDSGGACSRSGSTFTINIGTITLGTAKPKSAYFGITIFNAHDGTFKNQAVAWQLPRMQKAIVGATITLSHGMQQGSFSGTVLGTGQLVTGGFVCSGPL